MKYQALPLWALLSVAAAAQSGSDAAAILTKVGAAYRAPFSLELKGTKIHEQRDEFSEVLIRTPFTILLTAEGQCRVESRTKMGDSLQIYDGTKNWSYLAQSNKYFGNSGKLEPASIFETQVDLRNPISQLTESKLLRQETLDIGGTKHLCDVIEATYDRQQKQAHLEYGPVTFWVEHDTWLVWKTSVPLTMDLGQHGGKTPTTETALYSSIQMNVELPPGTFVFTPPAGATEQKLGAADEHTAALIGRPAPDFKLRDLDGKDLQLASLKGKIVLLDFWATWCEPCREAMPKLDLLAKEFKDKDLVVLAINEGEDEETVRAFAKKNGYRFPILLAAPGDVVVQNYQANAIPSMVLIDRKSIVADYKVGSNGAIEQTLRADFERVSKPDYVPPVPSKEINASVTATSTTVAYLRDPVTAIDFVHRGYKDIRGKDYTAAIRDANSALKLQPDLLSALRLRAQASYDAKDYEAVIADDTAILQKYPDWAQVYDQRGLAYSYSGKHGEAIPDYTRAIELDPYLAAAYNNRGWAYLESGSIDDALRDLNRAIDLSPEYTRAYENRAKAFDKRNDLASELADLDVILRIAPANQWAKDRRDELRKRAVASSP